VSFSPSTVIQAAWGLWVISWIAAAGWSSPIEKRPRSGHETLWRLLMALGALLLFGTRARWLSIDVVLWRPGEAAAWTLVWIAIAGLAFTWWARIALGRLWSSGVTRKVDHLIVTAGPYRIVRHPIYSGMILAAIATAFLRGTVASCAGATLIAVGLIIKARVEEGFLRSELGEMQYGAYARRVPMLVPFLREAGISADRSR
jgi:protein-S-isoprenylcysteine O-methyltransferase Ste14